MTSVAIAIWSIFADYGVAKIIQSDNGSEFVNQVTRKLVQLYGIQHRTVSAYTPRANGQVERSNQTLLGVIRKMIEGCESNWATFIPFAQIAINSKISTVHGSTPFAVLFNRLPKEWRDYQETAL